MQNLPYIPIKDPLSPDVEEKTSEKNENPSSQKNNNSDNPNNKYSNLRTLFPVILVLIALPLVVIASLQRQTINQKAASVDCNNGLTCTACIAAGNTCSYGNGAQTCTYNTHLSGQTCNPITFNNVLCFKSNCSTGFTCNNQQCVNTNPTVTTAPTSTPTPTSSSTKIVTVSSIAALKAALADNTVDEIVVVNGTYSVTTASSQQANSLWIGSAYAGRTRPILVRAQTPGGVTFNGGGAAYFGGISFEEGVHDQTWDGFVFANGTPTATGVIVFGGYSGLAAPHHITLRNITLPSSITSASPGPNDHGVYFAHAVGGPHDILIDGLTVNGSGGLDSAVHFFHSDASNRNAWNVTVRNMNVTGTEQAVMIWDSTVQNILIENSTITNATGYAIRYEETGTLTIKNVTSTGSGGGKGFYSSLGSNPPQVTFINSNLK